jgi:hypothetical protein
LAAWARSGLLSDEKENQVRELGFAEIHSENILFIAGNKFHVARGLEN